MKKIARIGIVAGEVSGDILGSSLLIALKKKCPDCIVEGIGGPLMIKEGCRSLFPLSSLSVMGFVEPLKRLPQLVAIRKQLMCYFINNPPDVFIGVDYPEFNISLERALKKQNILTVHYVSPSVWAWRKRRIHKIKKAVDLMLTLFPFENDFYNHHHVRNCFVGHPLADDIVPNADSVPAKKRLGLQAKNRYIALLPGSRTSELRFLTDIFLQAAQLCLQQFPELHFICPVTDTHHRHFVELRHHRLTPHLPLTIIDGQSRSVLEASDVALMASGTATLEACLLGRPVVAAYKMGRFTHALLKCLVKIPFIALPNLLAGKRIVPEFIQAAATPENCANAVCNYLTQASLKQNVLTEFTMIRHMLQQDASVKAVAAIKELIDDTHCRCG